MKMQAIFPVMLVVILRLPVGTGPAFSAGLTGSGVEVLVPRHTKARPGSPPASGHPAAEQAKQCRICNRSYGNDFRYCPYDGAALDAGARGRRQVREVWRDGRFIAYSNGTVLDSVTGLMWPAKDNGGNIAWPEAQTYAAQLRLGGYQDWRLPSLAELATLFDRKRPNRTPATDYCSMDRYATELINLSCGLVWSGDGMTGSGRTTSCARLNFEKGSREWVDCHAYDRARVLPVRDGGD